MRGMLTNESGGSFRSRELVNNNNINLFILRPLHNKIYGAHDKSHVRSLEICAKMKYILNCSFFKTAKLESEQICSVQYMAVRETALFKFGM
jgi:hypothetical protein